MKSKVRDIANNILRVLPLIKKIPFLIGWGFVRICSFISGRGRLQLAVRNSYALGYFEPLYSDIDVTVIGERADLLSFISQLNKLRSKLSIIGEVNAFEKKDASEAACFANPFELFRDPLLRKIGLVRSPGDADKLVFLIKMLEADYQALKTRPHTRVRKWNQHLGMLFKDSLNGQLPSLNMILDIAAKHLDLVNENFKRSLLKYFSEVESGRALHLVAEEHLSQNPWWWSCFPNRFCFLSLQQTLTAEQMQVLIRSVNWEIFGMLAQKLQMDKSTTQQHLLDLRKLAQTVLGQNDLSTEDRKLLEAATASSLFATL